MAQMRRFISILHSITAKGYEHICRDKESADELLNYIDRKYNGDLQKEGEEKNEDDAANIDVNACGDVISIVAVEIPKKQVLHKKQLQGQNLKRPSKYCTFPKRVLPKRMPVSPENVPLKQIQKSFEKSPSNKDSIPNKNTSPRVVPNSAKSCTVSFNVSKLRTLQLATGQKRKTLSVSFKLQMTTT